MYRFIIVLLIISFVSVPVVGETKIFLKQAKLDLPSILIGLSTGSRWVHAGLIVDGVAIEVGVSGLNIHTDKIDNAIFLDVDINLTKKEAIKRAENRFDHFTPPKDILKIILNKLLGTNFVTEGTNCSELVAHILGIDDADDVIPKDFIQKELTCSGKTCKFIT